MPALHDDDGPELLDLPGTSNGDDTPSDEDNGNGPTAAELAAEAARARTAAEADPEGDPEPESGAAAPRMIPKGRFDEVNNERKTLAEQLAQAQATIAALAAATSGKAAAAAPAAEDTTEAPAFDLKKAMRERLTALATGDDDRALELDEQIHEYQLKKARELARADLEAARAQQDQNERVQTLQATAAEIKAKYPELNDKSPDADADAITFVIAKRDALVAAGRAPHEALREASEIAAKRFGFAADGAAPTAVDPAAARLLKARERNAQTAALQPPELGGRGNRATQTARADVATMTDEEFAALPEAEKKRLRGDM